MVPQGGPVDRHLATVPQGVLTGPPQAVFFLLPISAWVSARPSMRVQSPPAVVGRRKDSQQFSLVISTYEVIRGMW